MKALSRIHLVASEPVRVAEPIEQAQAIWAQNHARGSTFYFTRVDGQGKPKRVVISPVAITRIEEL